MNEIANMYEQLSPENRAKVEAETVRLLARQNDPLSLERTERHPLPSEEVHGLAHKILLDSGVRKLPIDIVGLCRKFGMEVKYVTEDKRHLLRGHEGSVTEVLDGVPYILVDKSLPYWERRYAAACGLGYFLLGHIPGTERYQERSANLLRGGKELEASTFAAEILAPSCVLDLCGVPHDPQGEQRDECEAQICNISGMGGNNLRLKYYTYNNWRNQVRKGEREMTNCERDIRRRFWVFAFLYRVKRKMGMVEV